MTSDEDETRDRCEFIHQASGPRSPWHAGRASSRDQGGGPKSDRADQLRHAFLRVWRLGLQGKTRLLCSIQGPHQSLHSSIAWKEFPRAGEVSCREIHFSLPVGSTLSFRAYRSNGKSACQTKGWAEYEQSSEDEGQVSSLSSLRVAL